MSTVSSPAALPTYIEKLLSDREAHVAAIGVIDATMARVTAALGASAPKSTATATPAAPKKTRAKRAKAVKAPAAPKAVAPKAAVTKAQVGRRSKTGMTANEFVIEFIKSNKNPTSQEINKHWQSSGRKGMADNNLSLLTKAKAIKRMPLGEGIRGSRYSVA